MGRILITCIILSATARANPIDAFGLGARSIALGGAATANTEDSSANYYNPSALALSRGLRLDLGYAYVQPTLRLNDNDQDVDSSRGLQVGAILPTKLGRRRIAFSVGLHLPDERISRVRALPQRQPRWVLWDNRPQRLVVSSSVALELVENLYFGAGLTYLANTAGVVDLRGDVDLLDAQKTNLSTKVDVNLKSIRYVSAGLTYRPSSRWRLGVAYREDFSLRLDLAVNVQGDVVIDGAPVVSDGRFYLSSRNDNLYSPQQLVGGLAYTGLRWNISLDLGWINWAKYPTPTAHVQLDLTLDPLDVSLPLPAKPTPPGFRDIWTPRVGIEWTAMSTNAALIQLRSGYFYEPTPTPAQDGHTNYVDLDKHGFSLGLGIHFLDTDALIAGPLELDITIQSIVLPRSQTRKRDPADPIGEYAAEGYTLGGFVSLGVNL